MSRVLFAGKYCGSVRPRPLVSLTNRLTVYFNTNDMTNGKGFKAHYKAVAPELASGKSISAGKTTFTPGIMWCLSRKNKRRLRQRWMWRVCTYP